MGLSVAAPSVNKEISMDPVTLEVLRGQLDAVAEEMQVTLLKSSYSTII